MEKERRRKPIREGKDHRPKERGTYFFFFNGWEKGQRRGPADLGIYSGALSGKTAPWGRAAEGWSLTWAGGGGAERLGVTKEGTLTQTPRMTTACRLVPHAAHGRSARRRVWVAALSAPPPRKTPPGPAQEGLGRTALEPAGAALALEFKAGWGSITQQGSDSSIFTCTAHSVHSGLNYSYKYLRKGGH